MRSQRATQMSTASASVRGCRSEGAGGELENARVMTIRYDTMLESGLDFAGPRSSIGAKVSDLMAAVGNATGMGALRDR